MTKKIISSIVTLILLFSIVSAIVPGIVSEPPELLKLEVDKKVRINNIFSSSDMTSPWVDKVCVDVGETVRFNITLFNNGTVGLLGFIVVDVLPEELEYVNGSAKPPESDQLPDSIIPPDWPHKKGKLIIWKLEDELLPGEKLFIEFDAVAVKPGVGINYVIAGSPIPLLSPISSITHACYCYDDDTAVVCVKPGLIVEKTVKNETSGWQDEVTVNVGDTVRFNITIINTWGIPLFKVLVNDTFPTEVLKYADNASPYEPKIHGDHLIWAIEESIDDVYYIEFDAVAVKPGVGVNRVNVSAIYSIPEDPVSNICCVYDEDIATVYVRCEPEPGSDISVKKYVKLDCTGDFEKYVEAEIGDWVAFKIEVTNTGETPLDITVLDSLDDGRGLTYNYNAEVDGVPQEPTMIDDYNFFWELYDVQPGTSIIITFEADVDECETHINLVNVTGKHECQEVYDEDTATVDVECDEEVYTLTVIIIDENGGSVAKDPDQTSYPSGTVVELSATADSGWTFSHWSGDLTGSDNPDTITMDGNKTVTAHFTEDHDTPPTVEITKPKEYFLYKNNILRRPLLDKTKIIGPITIKVNAEDNVGVDRVEFYIDGVLKYTDESAPYQWTWWVRSSLKTNYTIKVIAYDTSDNSNSVEIDVVREGYRPLRNHPFLTLASVVGGSALLLKKLLDLRSGEEETPEEEPEIPEEPEEEPEEPVEHEAPEQTEDEEGGEVEIFWYIVGALSLILLIAVVLLLVRRKYYV